MQEEDPTIGRRNAKGTGTETVEIVFAMTKIRTRKIVIMIIIAVIIGNILVTHIGATVVTITATVPIIGRGGMITMEVRMIVEAAVARTTKAGTTTRRVGTVRRQHIPVRVIQHHHHQLQVHLLHHLLHCQHNFVEDPVQLRTDASRR